MTDPRQAAIEAAALALVNHNRALAGAAPLAGLDGFSPMFGAMQAAIAAYERALSDAGVVRVWDVGEHDDATHGNPYSGYQPGEGSIEYAYGHGHNDCRAAMLARPVGGVGDE